MDEYDLQKLWDTELIILDEIDRICNNNGLRYSLAYGTLLGAVRHGGFIPWDDDIDVMMPREDYNRLKEIWTDQAGKEFIIQDKSREIEYTQNFVKIRKDHSAYVQDEKELNQPYHTGVFVDIFPAERKAPGFISRKIQILACKINLLYSREFSSGERTDKIEKALLCIPRALRMKIWRLTEILIQKWSKKATEPFFFPCTNTGIYKLYPADMFDHMERIFFCNKEYMSIKEKEEVLTIAYGDYMKLPPESERVLTHHPLYVSLETNYNK